MRTRETRTPLVTSSTHIVAVETSSNPDRVDTDRYGLSYHTPAYERIDDDQTTKFMVYREGTRRRVMKPVRHVKWSATTFPQERTQWSTDSYYWTGSGPAWITQVHYPGYDLGEAAYGYAMSRIPPDTGHYNRWQAVKPSMATRANLFVSLAELTDCKRLWDIIPKKHTGLERWGQVLPHWANGLHLNYEFGWKPLVSDIKNVFRGVADHRSRLDKLLKSADRDLVRRFTNQTTVSENRVVWNPYISANERFRLNAEVSNSSSFHYAYDLPPMPEGSLQWRAWADTLGLNPSLANLWELVPWSFVVDWFVDVGGYLRTYQTDWLQPWITLFQSCYSQKVTGSLQWDVEWAGYGQTYVMPVCSLKFSTYSRSLGLPQFTMATDPLDADKIRLGASLLYSLHK